MRLEEHYLHLREELDDYSEYDPFHITIKEISELLFCTERHAKLILKKMSELNWIRWKTFRGRGKKPMLTFLYSKTEMERLTVKELLKEGKYAEVMEKLNRYHLRAEEEVQHFLINYFGFSTDKETEPNHELDILRYPLHQKIKNLNPMGGNSRQHYQVIRLIFDTLLRFDPWTKTVKPHQCFHWEHNQEGTEWYFYLRKGIYFHNGEAVDASSVKYSLDRIILLQDMEDPTEIVQLKDITVISKYVVKITLHQPSFLLLNLLCDSLASVVPLDWDEQSKETTIPQ